MAKQSRQDQDCFASLQHTKGERDASTDKDVMQTLVITKIRHFA
ncbi:MAG: hypothetical protein PUP90_17635 [Nostoc sp. S4]|nr:hypothetical protein [Nostoc sp. S4]